MKRLYAAALIALLATAAFADDSSESLYDISLKGAWSTPGNNAERFLKIEFAADTFTMHLRDGDKEIVESGMYQQDSRIIYLIITHGNKQTQKQLNYEVVDQYSIRVFLDGKRFMLERAE